MPAKKQSKLCKEGASQRNEKLKKTIGGRLETEERVLEC